VRPVNAAGPRFGVTSIDVIIVTRTRELVLSALSHLAGQTVAHTTYLADNGGDADGTSDAVRSDFPGVHVTTYGRNQGFSRAVNELAALGRGEVIVLLNDDVDVEPDFLHELVAPFDDERVGMCAGLTLQPGAAEIVDGFGIEVDRTLIAYNRLRHRRPSERPGVLLGPSGGAAAYRREAWEAAGGFDPRLFFYSEDLDLDLRLRLAGWEAAAAAAARGIHLGGASSGRDTPFQRWHGGFGRGFILRRYGILRTRDAPRALALEALTIARGGLATRSMLPLRARVAGWRAAKATPRLERPRDGIEWSLTLRQTLHRHLRAR
jgi:N-acetylglucosaminyl-diphospho-decaprenol L-rhamnosyltransferase